MNPVLTIGAWVLGLLLAALSAVLLHFALSPMPVVRLLRRGMDGELTVPPGYDEIRTRVEVRRDIPYPSAYGKNTFDLYLPQGSGQHPLVLWVHGGAFVAGDKSGVENWGVMLAGQGYAAAVMNYEWAPEAAYPAQLIQITEALREIGRIARESGRLDMEQVAVAGDSAGAHMAAQFALIHTNRDFSERLKIVSPLDAGALKCALLYCGPYDLQKMLELENKTLRLFVSRIGWSYLGRRDWKKAPLADTIMPMGFVTGAFVPTYLTDGNTGSFEGHARALGEALRAAGVRTQERYFDRERDGETGHEYQTRLDDPRAMDCFHDTIKFLEETMGGRLD